MQEIKLEEEYKIVVQPEQQPDPTLRDVVKKSLNYWKLGLLSHIR